MTPFVILALHHAEVSCHNTDSKTSLYLVECLNMPSQCCGFIYNLLCYLLLPKLITCSQSCCHQEISLLTCKICSSDTSSQKSSQIVQKTHQDPNSDPSLKVPGSQAWAKGTMMVKQIYDVPTALELCHPSVIGCTRKQTSLPPAKSEDDALVVLPSSQSEVLLLVMLSSSSISIIDRLECL